MSILEGGQEALRRTLSHFPPAGNDDRVGSTYLIENLGDGHQDSTRSPDRGRIGGDDLERIPGIDVGSARTEDFHGHAELEGAELVIGDHGDAVWTDSRGRILSYVVILTDIHGRIAS